MVCAPTTSQSGYTLPPPLPHTHSHAHLHTSHTRAHPLTCTSPHLTHTCTLILFSSYMRWIRCRRCMVKRTPVNGHVTDLSVHDPITNTNLPSYEISDLLGDYKQCIHAHLMIIIYSQYAQHFLSLSLSLSLSLPPSLSLSLSLSLSHRLLSSIWQHVPIWCSEITPTLPAALPFNNQLQLAQKSQEKICHHHHHPVLILH